LTNARFRDILLDGEADDEERKLLHLLVLAVKTRVCQYIEESGVCSDARNVDFQLCAVFSALELPGRPCSLDISPSPVRRARLLGLASIALGVLTAEGEPGAKKLHGLGGADYGQA